MKALNIYKLSLSLKLTILLKTWSLKKYNSILSTKYVENMIINHSQIVQSKAEKKDKSNVITITVYIYSARHCTKHFM